MHDLFKESKMEELFKKQDKIQAEVDKATKWIEAQDEKTIEAHLPRYSELLKSASQIGYEIAQEKEKLDPPSGKQRKIISVRKIMDVLNKNYYFTNAQKARVDVNYRALNEFEQGLADAYISGRESMR